MGDVVRQDLFIRDELEKREYSILHRKAQKADQSRGRLYPEEECPLRTCYQRDRDRIVHSKAFRRLKHKTQVFLAPMGDHYRTRLTHTLEVSQIARAIGRALALNEDLIEAIALGHDLGHTPFGHGGEKVLNELMPGGFRHYEQSLRVVDVLEKNGRGLNLTYEVRDGIVKHSKGRWGSIPGEGENRPVTLEGQVVRVADIIAYLSHDLDDAMRAGVLKEQDIPREIVKWLGDRHSIRIHSLVLDVVRNSLDRDLEFIGFGDEMLQCVNQLRSFLFEQVYDSEILVAEIEKAGRVIKELFYIFMEDDRLFEQEIGAIRQNMPREQQVCDYIAGMTDRYALDLYKKLFLPRPWMKV
ncbi:MAG: deoxyguanosinetriphosphate triphosphohydrolase [Deltaproteobacteria bacterium]|nr:deoxyguanosinetriphosphate triphosphohydrolase [Deltaproteobacteria bacterium]MBW2067263.1 deoxyguanosinetriphosphate triphosphohydrolase [Deltaproteobacteria bacterium]